MHSRDVSIPVDAELRAIADEIVTLGKSESEWAEIESDDMFQSRQWCGGFDADERAFTFSYWDERGREHWCVLSLLQMAAVSSGAATTVLLTNADR